MWRDGTLVNSWWKCKLILLLWKTVWRFLKKLKIELPYVRARFFKTRDQFIAQNF